MRILFTRFPLESTLGGAEIQTLSLIKGLSERGHDVSFLGNCPVLTKAVADYGLRITKLDIGIPPVTKWAAGSFIWRKRKMQQLLTHALEIRNPKSEIIVMLSLSEKLLLTEAAVAKGIRVFWIEHDRVGPWLKRNPWLRTLRKLSGSVTTICVSELSRKIYVDLGWDAKKVVVIPNGIDLGRFAAGSGPHPQPFSPREKGAGTLKIGCIARLSPEKGVDVLIKVVTDLSDATLTIIGTGPDSKKIHNQLRRRNEETKKRIRILPVVSDVGTFYKLIDVLVLPSRDNDPFGLVAAEAMACGTPVIVTDQCGIAGYLTDGRDALIVRADSVSSLQEAILRMQDPDFRSRIAGHSEETVRRLFSLPAMTDAYEKLFTAN